MQKIRTIIVDDEPEAREGVKLLLEGDADIQLIGLCKNGLEAIDMINEHEIDLALLDIQMPVINGFEVVNSVARERLPNIIFVTAYDQYALKAFDIHAVDYILKPFTDQRFKEGLHRAKLLISQEKLQKQKDTLRSLSEELGGRNAQKEGQLISESQNDPSSAQRLVVKDSGRVRFIPLHDIIWLEAFDYYVKIHVRGHFYLVRESLKKLSERLPSSMFVRIHKSSTINISYIRSLTTVENGEYMIRTTTNEELKVSRSYRDEIKNLIR
jgi:two-component system LytT family response regulator